MPNFWTTKEGKKMLPHEFEDSHLINTLRFIERCASTLQDSVVLDCLRAESVLNGDMAQYVAGQEAMEIGNMDYETFLIYHHPVYKDLMQEAKNRNLKWERAFNA